MPRDVSNKKYQVFISSTYTDLKHERAQVTEAILELGHMPYGMEVFPAANDSQWEWIKTAIDESDYYIVIIGGRYGSIKSDSGLSYTEMEYRYAISKGVPAIAFIIDSEVDLPKSKIETDPEKAKKLEQFKQYISENKLWKSYSSAEDLKAKVYPSLLNLIRTCPREGWVRANVLDQYTSNTEVLKLVRENASLKENKGQLANGDDVYKIEYKLIRFDFPAIIHEDVLYEGEYQVTWDSLFGIVAEVLYNKFDSGYIIAGEIEEIENKIREHISSEMYQTFVEKGFDMHDSHIQLKDGTLKTIFIQFEALEYIAGRLDNYDLTKTGKKKYLQMKALKRKA